MRKNIAFVFGLLFFISGCGVPQDTAIEIESAPPAIAERAEKVFEPWQQEESPSPADFCKVPDQRPLEHLDFARGRVINGSPIAGPSGFPLVEQTVPTSGQVDWLIVMVSFKDTAKYVDSPSEFLNPQIEKLEAWADFWSQGKMQFNVSYVDYWVELPINASEMPQDDLYVANMIASKMPRDMQPSSYDVTYVQWADLQSAPGVEEKDGIEIDFALRVGSNENRYEDFSNGPSLFWAPGYYHSSDQKQPLSLKREFAYMHWIHEILHEMGLNLHAPGNGWSTGVGQALYPNSYGHSLAVNSWELFQLGWINDSQVHCIDRVSVGGSRTALAPTDSYGGERKMIAIPTNNDKNEVLVVEARQSGAWTSWEDGQAGLLVYRVDPSATHRDHVEGDCGNDPEVEKWAYYIYPEGTTNPEPNCGIFELALVGVEESVIYDGIRITLEGSINDLYYVSVDLDASEAYALPAAASATAEWKISGFSRQDSVELALGSAASAIARASAKHNPDSLRIVVQQSIPGRHRLWAEDLAELSFSTFLEYLDNKIYIVLGTDPSFMQTFVQNNGLTMPMIDDIKKCSYSYGSCSSKDTVWVAWETENLERIDKDLHSVQMLSHQVAHVFQDNVDSYTNGEIPPRESPFFRPVWFVEGFAEFHAFAVLDYSELHKYSYNGIAEYGDGATYDISLRDLEEWGDDYGSRYFWGQVAMEYLVANIGYEGVINIYSSLGSGMSFEDSFYQSSGITLDEFYVIFDEWATIEF